ncbi:MAG: AraC family transcriptional regulator [Lachnospiraceae bacterium]|nr:AraC family transcriptional regulator [Lachnospiraceae bacterium]
MKRPAKAPIPIHSHDELSSNGIHIKIVTPNDVDRHPIEYAHRDDYYIFGIIVRGCLCCEIDFKNQIIREGEIQFIRPGQIHRFINGENFEGWMLMLENGLVEDQYRLIFDEASVNGVATTAGATELDEIKTLFSIIQKIINRDGDKHVIKHMISALVGIIAGCFRESCHQQPAYNSRRSEIVLQLDSLLRTELSASHSPAFYARRLHLSPVYLNEAVKSVTGFSVSNYIRNEIVLRAKRMLYHTDLSVKQIAYSLGFEDNAYFTRLFTKATGKSPIKFRANH